MYEFSGDWLKSCIISINNYKRYSYKELRTIWAGCTQQEICNAVTIVTLLICNINSMMSKCTNHYQALYMLCILFWFNFFPVFLGFRCGLCDEDKDQDNSLSYNFWIFLQALCICRTSVPHCTWSPTIYIIVQHYLRSLVPL